MLILRSFVGTATIVCSVRLLGGSLGHMWHLSKFLLEIAATLSVHVTSVGCEGLLLEAATPADIGIGRLLWLRGEALACVSI